MLLFFLQSLSSDIYSNTKTESSEVEEKTLISAIEKRNVSDAIAVYDILEEKGCGKAISDF